VHDSLGAVNATEAEYSINCKLQRSFELFTCYSHHCPSRPASGLRLEITPNMDKKKSELYFSARFKKFLTEKRKGASRKLHHVYARTVAVIDSIFELPNA